MRLSVVTQSRCPSGWILTQVMVSVIVVLTTVGLTADSASGGPLGLDEEVEKLEEYALRKRSGLAVESNFELQVDEILQRIPVASDSGEVRLSRTLVAAVHAACFRRDPRVATRIRVAGRWDDRVTTTVRLLIFACTFNAIADDADMVREAAGRAAPVQDYRARAVGWLRGVIQRAERASAAGKELSTSDREQLTWARSFRCVGATELEAVSVEFIRFLLRGPSSDELGWRLVLSVGSSAGSVSIFDSVVAAVAGLQPTDVGIGPAMEVVRDLATRTQRGATVKSVGGLARTLPDDVGVLCAQTLWRIRTKAAARELLALASVSARPQTGAAAARALAELLGLSVGTMDRLASSEVEERIAGAAALE